MTKEKEKKRILFLVATNVVASCRPEQRLTGTSHARVKRVRVNFIILVWVENGKTAKMNIGFRLEPNIHSSIYIIGKYMIFVLLGYLAWVSACKTAGLTNHQNR